MICVILCFQLYCPCTITFTILSITTESKGTRTTANCVAVFEAGHVGVAGVNGTIGGFNVAARTSKPHVALARVVIDVVSASS